ncbi:MAG: aminopeptidase N [Halieaceae bacterium]
MKALFFAISLSLLAACSIDSEDKSNASVSTAYEAREPGNFLTEAVAKHRKRVVSSPAYTLSIDLDRAPGVFGGEVDINFTYNGAEAPLTIDFRQGELLSLTLNGKPVEYDYNGYFITLPAGSLKRGKQQLSVSYEHPYSQDGSGLYYYQDPEDGRVYLYTDFEPYDANRLFPHFDQPDLKAAYTLSVRAPAAWQVISTTRESEVLVDGAHRVWSFPPTPLLSSYVFSLHAGEYAMIEGPEFRYPMRVFARQSMVQYVDEDFWFDMTSQLFDYFDAYFDLPYPFLKYDQVLVPDYNSGAMENVAAVTFSETWLSRGESTRRERMALASVIAHEMAHMWFGDITTMAWWNGLWLNESFATVMAELALADGTEFKETWHQFFIGDKQWAYWEDQLVTTHAIELPVNDTETAFTNFDGITYGKGASVLKQLIAYLGEDVFRQGVRDYLAANAWSNTELEDFIGALAQAADRELDGWTQRWLYQAGLNSIEASYQCENGKISQMSLIQTAPEEHPTLREQRAELALYALQGDRLELQRSLSLLFDGSSTPVKEVVGDACPDFVYPNYRDLAYIKVALDTRSIATASQYINGLADPLQRSMAWYDLYSMVRDAKLDLTDYLDILAANLAAEQDRNAASDLLWNLRSAMSYLHMIPNGKPLLAEYAQRFEALLWKLLENSSGDARQQWLAAYIDTANNDVAWQRLQDLLAGDLVLQGFQLDQDQRWNIVMKLSEHRWPGNAELARAELQRDDSAIGEENAVRAQVLSARGEGKYLWMQKAIASDETFNLRRSRSIVGSLFPYSSQRALAEPYAVEMLAQLPGLDETHDVAFHNRVTSAMLPRLCTAENVRRLKQAAERYKDLNPAIVRGLKVAAQQDERCVNIGLRLADRGGSAQAAR